MPHQPRGQACWPKWDYGYPPGGGTKHRSKRQTRLFSLQNYIPTKCLNAVIHAWDWLEGNKIESTNFLSFCTSFSLCFFSRTYAAHVLPSDTVKKHDHDICPKAQARHRVTWAALENLHHQLQSMARQASSVQSSAWPSGGPVSAYFVLFCSHFHTPLCYPEEGPVFTLDSPYLPLAGSTRNTFMISKHMGEDFVVVDCQPRE